MQEPPVSPSPATAARGRWVKPLILLLMTGVIGLLIARHVDGINGPDYWRWPWRRPVNGPVISYLLLLLSAMPLLIAELRFAPRGDSQTGKSGIILGLCLMMGTVLCLELTDRGLDLAPFDLTRLATIIEEPGTTGYFTHAQEFARSGESVRDFLRQYVARMPAFTLHARNKPPGSILFYVPFVRYAATENVAAMAAGLVIALLATLSVPATYLLAAELTADRAVAFQAAACMALCPGLVLFLPEFDQFYPAYSCLLLWLWAKSLKTGKARFAAGFGFLFAVVCFQTFNLLLLGIFVAGYAGWFLSRSFSPANLKLLARQSAVVVGVMGGLYALLWLWSGYRPIATLVTGIANHSQDMPGTHRVWPRTIPFDLLDMALGMGWVCPLLAVFYLLRGIDRPLIWLCFGQVVAVALLGLLQGETARVCIFMFPLLLIPAGLELVRWRGGERLMALGCLWLLMALLSQNMVFV